MTPALGLISFVAAVLLYGSATTLFFFEVARSEASPQKADDPGRSAPLFLGGGAVAHAIYVVIASFVAKACPVHSIHFVLSIASLVATTTYLFARQRFRIYALGILVAPLGLVATLGTFFVGAVPPKTEVPTTLIGLHVVANVGGVSLFLLAGGAAVMYLLQERRLKSKKSLPKKGLPPLDSLDRAAHRFLLAGFPLLTIGVATGTVWARQLETGAVEQLLRSAFGYAAWLLIGGVLLLRVAAGWRGRKSAYGTVAGFACTVMVIIIYFVRSAAFSGGG